MRIVITGATGFVGRTLTHRLLRDRHEIVVLSRSPSRVKTRLGPEVSAFNISRQEEIDAAMESSDAVINLAGAPIAKRWTKKHRERLRTSRIDLTRKLVEGISRAQRKPSILISASAVGFYGDRNSEELSEDSAPGNGYLSSLCQQWEDAAEQANVHGVRVVRARIGLVLGRGGILEKLSPLARLGLAGRIGSGKQYMPWIHINDLVEMLTYLLDNKTISGAINCTAPTPVQQKLFAAELGKALGKPSQIPAPRFAFKILMGQASQIVLTGQRAIPKAVEAHGFAFQFEDIGEALNDIVALETNCRIGLSRNPPQTKYLRNRPSRYQLDYSQTVDAPLEEVFAFFARAENLGAITPDSLEFNFAKPAPKDMGEGVEIEHRIKIGPIPMRWLTVIEVWAENREFADAQHKGPYRAWYHHHKFRSSEGQTQIEDTVYYKPPLGFLGWIANWLFIRSMLRDVFAYRAQVIRQRFPERSKTIRKSAS